jgi:DNA-directed RNA polymerase specialized sigma24 family protein
MNPDDRANQRPEEGGSGHGRSPVPDAVSTVAMDGELHDFFLREYEYVIRFLMRCGASLNSAEAAAQHAFAEASRLPKRGAWASIPNQEAWIRTVAYKYLGLPYPQLVQAKPISYLSKGEPLRDNTSDLPPESRRILKALQGLPADQRIVMAFKMDQFSDKVIAVHIGMKRQEVRDLHEAARRALARSLAEMTTPPEEETRDR